MARQPIDPQVLIVALDQVTGQAFEDFVSEFQAALVGSEYVPVGGSGDGGADGYVADHLREDRRRTGHFLQTSVVEGVQGKIRDTVSRLTEVSRNPKVLTYFSSRPVTNVEKLEYELSEELKLQLSIRDRRYISAQINHSPHTQAAFKGHLLSFTLFLRNIGASTLIEKSDHVTHPDVIVFLRQELDRRHGGASLVDAVVDSLAVWALEGTEPTEGITMSEPQIREKILDSFPSARQYVESSLRARLQELSSKRFPGGRMVRMHRNEQTFALPFEARERIAADNAEDEAVRSEMIRGLDQRFRSVLGEAVANETPELCTAVLLRTIQLGFEREGLEFAHFVSRSDNEQHYHYLTDALALALQESNVRSDRRNAVADSVIQVLRLLFYSSSEIERTYLERLGRTYAILFTLQSEPRLIQYFEEMSGQFHLYIGSDLIIRALSERYLAPSDQITRNMLKIAATAGATLVLAEPVLDEIVAHIRASDREFTNHVAPAEEYVTIDLARQASRILIRAYLYARLADESHAPVPKTWGAYIDQFCDYATLHKPQALGDIRMYLQSELALTFESRRELEGLVSLREVAELAEGIATVKKRAELADNDALMCHAVYGRRERLGESSKVSEFGYNTWWLTGGETSILRFTRALELRQNDERFMMRPEFLLNFISLSPKAAEARKTFHNVFPTLLGIRIARRMGEDAYRALMDEVESVSRLELGRREAKMAQLANALKSDMHRQYRIDFEADRISPRGESIQPVALKEVIRRSNPSP